MNRRLVALALILLSLPNSALACLPPQPPPQLPGETDKAYEERGDENAQAQFIEDRRTAQIYVQERAKASFIGIVSDRHEIGHGEVGYEVRVRPVRTLKGPLPDAPVPLREVNARRCSGLDGRSITSAVPGDYLIIFQGVDTGPPDGIVDVGIFASEARDPFVLKTLLDLGSEAAH